MCYSRPAWRSVVILTGPFSSADDYRVSRTSHGELPVETVKQVLQNLVIGRLHTHRDGYGFVTPDPDSIPARAQGKLQGDIFIPPPELGNAMHGDRVLVEMGSIRPDGRAEGRIVRVTERKQETVVGIFHYGPRQNFVTPIDAKVATEIVIAQGMEYPSEELEEEDGGGGELCLDCSAVNSG